MTRRRAIVYGILFAAATTLWLHAHSERAQVRRVFDDIGRLAAKEPGESVMECAAKSKSLAEHFRNGCSVIDLAHGLDAIYSREDIAGGLLAFRAGAARIAVKFSNLEIRIDGNEAQVTGQIDCSGTDATWPGHESKVEGFIVHLEKADGRWLITRIKIR